MSAKFYDDNWILYPWDKFQFNSIQDLIYEYRTNLLYV